MDTDNMDTDNMEISDLSDEEDECTTDDGTDSESTSEEEVKTEWHEIKKRNPVLLNDCLEEEEEELLIKNIDCDDPFTLYKLFFTDCISERMVEETNRYAERRVNDSSPSGRRQHQQAWQPVTKKEMNTFIGILLIMGVTQLPDIRLHWSKKDMYTNACIKNAMSRDRFLSILRFLHFSDDTAVKIEDGSDEVRSIVKTIVDTFKNAVKPGNKIVIEESKVPLSFRQNVVDKKYKNGVKLHKLCFPGGYTYNIDVCAKKNATEKTRSRDVVMRLVNELLYEDRTIFTDKYYTSVPLAEELLQKVTFICGTVKIKKKFLPLQAQLKQKRGDVMSFEKRGGVKFLKWTDRRPVCMLTTSKSHTCTIIHGKNGKLMPDALSYYNDARKGVRLSDQMTSYYSRLRKTLEWHKTIIIQLICGTCLANAWCIHKKWGKKRINILQFREKIIDRLLADDPRVEEKIVKYQVPPKQSSHFLHSYKGPARRSRKRCRECYKCLYEKKGREHAIQKAKKVTTYCNLCEGKPALCLQCFRKLHKST